MQSADTNARDDLAPDQVHVWALRPSDVTDPSLFVAYGALLSPSERARHDRYAFEAGRREFLLTRALARTALARYAGVEPRALAFTEGERGRPELVQAPAHRRLRFNLSNTQGLIVCAVAWDLDVGIDAEHVGRRVEPLEIARSVFSPDELAGLHALPEGERRHRFFTLWTLKEAYIKARGLGLALPLGAFTLTLGDATPVSVRFDPPLVDDAASWQFEVRQATPEHLVSVALKTGPTAPRTLCWRETIPLVSP